MKKMYNKIMNRSIQKDVCIVLEEFLENAILKDNGDIWLDLYKPFGNSDKYGDIINILELTLNEDEEEIELTDFEEKLVCEYAKQIYKCLPLYIKIFCISVIKKADYEPFGDEFDKCVKDDLNRKDQAFLAINKMLAESIKMIENLENRIKENEFNI